MRRGLPTIFGTLIAASLLVSAPLAAQEAPGGAPDYSAFREGLFLRYLDAQPGGIARVPRIGLSFGGEVLSADLDSGSTGIVVAATYIPGLNQLPVQGPGELTYTSSGRVMVGQWVVTPVTLSGKEGASLTTAPLPVLAVTEVRCLSSARDCTPSSDPRHIAMVGVGFAREADRQSQSTPDKNPLLNIAPGERPRRQGYILTTEGVHIGLTAANTRGPFRYLKLERRPDGTDWQPTPACISLNGATPPACGSALVDTGVGAMFMTVPAAQAGAAGVGADGSPARTLPEGTQVAISVGAGVQAFPLYAFTVGDGSPLAPEAIHLRVAPDRVFVNTSFHLLNGYDVLFDGEGGYVGFRGR
ncbi:hypothetical protein AncyloWKF20_00320 [Ancylobacter sp. WKF20]|uniref:hypothetical protein n=1 Tax=Ancylobacter sp. WKF20 TaxID=3039801 RepID=UPI00243463E6|nr:hypothetical protein [Ancylobacter sp. WKF20]WGD30324.1 hypothetical protein AncyloWKF20_00320 [Ancylobacter sp. WKF20]